MKKLLLTLFIVLQCLLVMGCGDDSPKGNTAQDKTSIIANSCNVNKEQAKAINDIMVACDLTDFNEIVPNEKWKDSKSKGYYIQKNGRHIGVNLYVQNDGKIKTLAFPGKSMLYDRGKIVAKYTDFVVTEEQFNTARVTCQLAIKSLLKNPDSAKFPARSGWVMQKDSKGIAVQSSFDAKNSFNAKIRSNFTALVTPEGKGIKSLTIDGKKIK